VIEGYFVLQEYHKAKEFKDKRMILIKRKVKSTFEYYSPTKSFQYEKKNTIRRPFFSY